MMAKTYEARFLHIVFTHVKLSVSHWREKHSQWCSRAKHWEETSDPKQKRTL